MARRRTHCALALALAATAPGCCTVSLWKHNGFHPPPQNQPTAIKAAALDAEDRLWLRLAYASPWPSTAMAKLDGAQWRRAEVSSAPLPASTATVYACTPGELDRMLLENPDPEHHTLPPALWVNLETDGTGRAVVWVLDSHGPLRGQRITFPRAGPDWLAPETALHILVTPVTAATDLAVAPLFLLFAIAYWAGVRGH